MKARKVQNSLIPADCSLPCELQAHPPRSFHLWARRYLALVVVGDKKGAHRQSRKLRVVADEMNELNQERRLC